MTSALSRDLERLTHSGLELADPATDFRQCDVLDADGNPVGTVSDVLLDPDVRQVRLLEIETAGGMLGIGKKHHLVPIDIVRGDDPRTVHVDRTRDEILATPEYVPSEGDGEEEQYAAAYQAFGMPPYWTQTR